MTDVLRGRGVFDRHPFVLVDVGCAGGIAGPWRAFGPSLIAHGYDPDIDACEQAQAREPFPHVRYHAGFVGLPDSHPSVQRRRAEAARWPNTNIWGRVTAGHLPGKQQDGDESAAVRLADLAAIVGVEEIVRDEQLPTVDFLKVDVDGPDLEVLESAQDVLADRQVLGVAVEVNWFGSANPSEPTFHNTDRFVRRQGYALFGITVRPYSRTDLPGPFLRELYAETRFGQPYQGDAIYVRDLAAPENEGLADSYAAQKLIKLACVYELVGLPDCSAEVLNRFAPRLTAFGDTEELLDALTPPLLGAELTYRQYIAKFEEAPHLFLPSADFRGAGETVRAPGGARRCLPVDQTEARLPTALKRGAQPRLSLLLSSATGLRCRAVTAFDRYGDTYIEQLERATGGVGDPELFTEVKARLLLHAADRLLGPPGDLSVLDVGCGPGLTDSFLTGRFGSVAGVDVSMPMVERARQANPSASYECYDGRRLPFETGSFDLTFAICVLHHVERPDRPAFAAEAARVTRRGGIVAILEHNPLNPLTRLVVSRCEFDEGVELVGMREAERLLARAGADAAESRYILFFPWHSRVFRRAEGALGSVPLGAQYMVSARRR
jgi:SAM-dependent methyltransferase